VKELCVFAIDCVNKTAHVVDYETPYEMIRTTNIKSGFIHLDEVRYVSEETFEKWTRRSKPEFGDVVLTREAPVGEVGRCTYRDRNIFLGQRIFHYRPNPELLDWNFLAYVLQSRDVQGRIQGMGFGATVQHITVGDAENLTIPCPPLNVQKRIGEALANYDDLIENNRRRIQLFEESLRLLYQEWFVHLRFPGHEHADTANGVPEGWQAVPLAAICMDIRETIKPSQVEPNTPYIGLEHMPRRSITLNEWGYAEDVESNKFRYAEGDILFGKIRPYFHKVGFTLSDGICSSDAIVIRAHEKDVTPYVLALVSSDQFVAVASKTAKEGSKMPRADWKFMQQHTVLLPSRSVLLSFRDSMLPIMRQLKVLALQNHKLTQARDLLLPRLMNGEITV
jgi:type I restriction enzyme S subunit